MPTHHAISHPIRLLPASLLGYRSSWKRLPASEVLILTSPTSSRLHSCLERIAQVFRARGRHVTLLELSRWRGSAAHTIETVGKSKSR